jgi:peptide/nickel transport system substrate-binding protein
VLRRKLAIPAAVFVLLSGVAGMGAQAIQVHARVAADTYSGTLSVSDYQAPGALGGGGLGNSQANQDLGSMMWDSATGIDNKGNFYADLATDVPSTANGGIKVVGGDEIITYHIKPNLKWSDGSAITPADWILPYLIDFSQEFQNTDPFNQIKTVTWSGNDLVMHLSGTVGSALQQLVPGPIDGPVAYLQKKYGVTLPAGMLASWDYAKTATASGLIPASVEASSGLDKFAKAWINDNYNSPSDVFNGPYMLQSWSPDQRYVLVANPYYTALPAATGHPRPAKIQQIVLSEDGTVYVQDLKAATTYQTIDSATDFTPSQISDLKSTKYQVSVVPELGYELLDLMVGPTDEGKANPLHDVRVRQALDDAINKDLYITALFPGFQPKQLELASLLPGSSPWSVNSQLPQNDYNPAKAMSLLKAAGYATQLGGSGNHLNLNFVTTTRSDRLKSSQILQRFWNQVGVSIRISYAKAAGQNGLFSPWTDGGIMAHHDFQIAEHGFTENVDPDEGSLNWLPDQITTASNPNGVNEDDVNDPHLTSLWLQGRTSLDNAKRHAIYNEVQKYVWQQMYNISLYTTPGITLYKGTVGNAKPNFTQYGPWWNGFQLWYDPTNSQKILAS